MEEVDVQEEAAGWGVYLRVKVSIELSKPLARGRMLHIPRRSIWVAFKYEKLPKFCYTCGLIYHGRQGCSSQGKGKQNAEEEEIQYGSWLWVAFPPRRSSGGEERYGGRSFTGNQFWRPKHINSCPVSPCQRSARESTTGSDSGKDLEVQIPSAKEDHPCMETNQTLRAKIRAGKLPMNVVRDFSMMNVGHLRKWTVTKEGHGSGRSKTAGDSLSDLDALCQEQLSGPKVKYMGSWDTGLGRMVYEPIEEFPSVFLLGQEKVKQPYPPRARDGSSEQLFEVAIDETVSGNPREEGGLEKRKELEENVADFQHGRGGHRARGPATSWKKRARQGQGSPRSSSTKGSSDGKRKIANMVAEDVFGMPKKGRTFNTLLSQESEKDVKVANSQIQITRMDKSIFLHNHFINYEL